MQAFHNRTNWGRNSQLTPQHLTSDVDAFYEELRSAGKATRVGMLCAATERLAQLKAMLEGGENADASTRAILRGRLEIIGPVIADALAAAAGVTRDAADITLAALATEGVVLRGRFTTGPVADLVEWCDRRILSRIHRYTLNRLLSEIEPVFLATATIAQKVTQGSSWVIQAFRLIGWRVP